MSSLSLASNSGSLEVWKCGYMFLLSLSNTHFQSYQIKTYFHISTLPELLDKDIEDIFPHFHTSRVIRQRQGRHISTFPHFHTSTLPELLDKDNQDTQRQWRHISTFPHFQSQQLKVLDSTMTRHCSEFMLMHKFVSITTTVAYCIHLS